MKKAYGALIAALLLAGCTGNNNLLDQFDKSLGNTVTAPERDGSVPTTASLIIPDIGNGIGTTLKIGMLPQTFNLTYKAPSFFVLAVAEDLQGIKSLALFTTYVVDCTGPDGTSSNPPQATVQETTNPATAGQATRTRMWLPYYVDTDIFNGCAPGYTFNYGQLAVGVRATNYGDGFALSPEATFLIKP